MVLLRNIFTRVYRIFVSTVNTAVEKQKGNIQNNTCRVCGARGQWKRLVTSFTLRATRDFATRNLGKSAQNWVPSISLPSLSASTVPGKSLFLLKSPFKIVSDVKVFQVFLQVSECMVLVIMAVFYLSWFMQSQHVGPEEALQIHRLIRAKKSIGVHWGTFDMGSTEVCLCISIPHSQTRKNLRLRHEFHFYANALALRCMPHY